MIKSMKLCLNFKELYYCVLIIYFCKFCLLAELGLHCSTWALSSCMEGGYSLVAVCGLFIVVVSLVVEPRL